MLNTSSNISSSFNPTFIKKQHFLLIPLLLFIVNLKRFGSTCLRNTSATSTLTGTKCVASHSTTAPIRTTTNSAYKQSKIYTAPAAAPSADKKTNKTAHSSNAFCSHSLATTNQSVTVRASTLSPHSYSRQWTKKKRTPSCA